jgi:hypothetical protein
MDERPANYELEITPEDIQAYLDETRIPLGCPFCRQSDWAAITHHERGQPGVLLVPKTGFPLPPAVILAYVLICQNCGYLAEFSVVPVEQWKAKKGGAGGTG